ncbi:MAG: membrane or secreted protein [Bacteroidota bacterium]|nr:membrane or secreted protein [Bacteroidota bacterium]
MKFFFAIILSCFITFINLPAFAQRTNAIYIDQHGRMRWQKDHSEVYLFGINYTVPFAYGYRSVKALHKDIEKEIDEDVYHLARMGADAFRVHIWDTEISDTTGNLLPNEHLKLFDYLIYKLKQRGIKIIITPIAFWGNGYPQRDEKTAGFSSKYNKGQATVNENAIKAQENYMRQLLLHVNPYTNLNYRDEPDIIAAELNNEPSHSGSKEKVTDYINRLALAARGTGWSKPLFYNISQSPYYADAVAKSSVDGFSFQWYPTGLVAGHEQKGNFLPNVDRYTIPFDTIPAFRNKAKMVYEFDAADVLQSCMYPAVAKSFKLAGFQWVTQFAYDPLATAYGNTEYQTHFLNLAYTPAKAISFLIANRVFHMLPRDKQYGTYPADSVFDAYHVSYNQSMSEMNTAAEFYYSGATVSSPINILKLDHIAGVGSSAIVSYKGYGAYFLDKLENGVWRLEVMPDAITVRDPFARPSPVREAVHIQWADQPMQLSLPDIGNDFSVKAINADNTYKATASNGAFTIKPGTYLLAKNGKSFSKWKSDKTVGPIGLDEFVAPQPFSRVPYVSHTPPAEVSSGKTVTINVQIINIAPDAKVSLLVSRGFGPSPALVMEKVNAYDYRTVIPAAQVTSGMITYRIVIQNEGKYFSFPGGYEGDPYSWDNINIDTWQTFVASPKGKLSLFNATADRGGTNTYYPVFTRNSGVQFTSGEETGQLTFKASSQGLQEGQVMGFQLYVGDKIKQWLPEVSAFKRITVRARKINDQETSLHVVLTNDDASSYSALVNLGNEFQTISIPLSAFKPDSSLLLPRPYPGFLPVWFKASSFSGLNISRLDKLEVTAGNGPGTKTYSKPFGVEVETVSLEP